MVGHMSSGKGIGRRKGKSSLCDGRDLQAKVCASQRGVIPVQPASQHGMQPTRFAALSGRLMPTLAGLLKK